MLHHERVHENTTINHVRLCTLSVALFQTDTGEEQKHDLIQQYGNMGCNIGSEWMNCDYSISYDMNEVVDQLMRFWVNGEDVFTMIN